MPSRSLLLLAALLLPAAARSQTVLDWVRTGQWPQADAAVADMADPLARKLVLYYRLLTPGAATAPEVADFIAANPGWPNQAALVKRLNEALLADKNDQSVLAICANRPPSTAPALLRCADAATAAAAASPTATNAARLAWIAGITDPAGELAFLKRWATQITLDDQWRRFDRLAWTEPTSAPTSAPGPAARQALRLPAPRRPEADTRLALRRDDPAAPTLFASLSAPQRADPTMVIELARYYRRANLDPVAAAIWTGQGAAAEAAAPPDRRGAFWDERNLLARRLLRENQPALAEAVAALPATTPDAALDQHFLAGWIALRRLNNPAAAAEQFKALAAGSQSAITQARAHYWLARAAEDAGDPATARAEYAAAAKWPTTYYGQLAALAGGNGPAALARQLTAAQDPAWDEARAAQFLAEEPARAAVLLAAWGDKRRAKAFLARLDDGAADTAERALAARLALGLGLPEQAVAIARRAGRDGLMLPGAGWPAPVTPPDGPVDGAVVLGLIRQESSFDVEALSPVGARGLMQLMPATASGVAKRLGVSTDVPALTGNASYNVRLGTAYLGSLLDRFGGALPLAIASYNAGPARVQDWLATASPGEGPLDMIDWIELIPFNETRNYVQRVIENIVIYRAQLGETGPHPVEVQRLEAAAPGPG